MNVSDATKSAIEFFEAPDKFRIEADLNLNEAPYTIKGTGNTVIGNLRVRRAILTRIFYAM
jgi:hypothetical protein